MNNSSGDFRQSMDSNGTLSGNVLFDIDAIRKELESEMIEVRQLESTLPPMQLDLNGNTAQQSPHSHMRHTKSSDASMGTETRTVTEVLERSPSPPLPEELASLKLPPRPSEIDDDNPYPDQDQNVSMTFDHDCGSPREPRSTPQAMDTFSRDRTPSPPHRPKLKTSMTMPTSMSTNFGAMNLEHNAWADDDEDFPKEKEMRMTFE